MELPRHGEIEGKGELLRYGFGHLDTAGGDGEYDGFLQPLDISELLGEELAGVEPVSEDGDPVPQAG